MVSSRRLEEGTDKRVRMLWCRSSLRHEQSRYEEWVLRDLKDSGLVVPVHCDDSEATIVDQLLVGWIEPEVAVVTLLRCQRA
jgi:hypothetical protein